MGQFVLREPVILYETVEVVYQHVNGITIEKRKNDLLRKYGGSLTPEEKNWMDQVCRKLTAVQKICDNLPDDPALTYYFQKWDNESQWQNICLAKLLIYSFFNIRVTDFQEALEQTRREAEARLSAPYILSGLNSGGLSFRFPEQGEPVPDLVEQLDQMALDERYCWMLYKALRHYPQALQELTKLLEPLAAPIKEALWDIIPLANKAYDGWTEYFSQHPFSSLLEDVTNQTLREDNLDVYINISMMAAGDIMFTYDTLGEKQYRQAYIGILLNRNFRMNRVQMTDEVVCSLLRIISDRSRFEILRQISQNSTYCQALSKVMGLTTATISRHMSLLLDAGLVRARREENRIYYDLERKAVMDLCETISKILLG